ncbi:hypothetical protein FCL40_03805 [Ferrimonas sediminicola]|uniref:Nickel/cobalt transporter regulator n=1 Tax=Ferrimonas sediminicola TaxID=2569538 RepID=A0A4U1BHQ1_9GAMM|nr:hypothetical protein [Ferrimonas sediminicola]TKB50296.1 hypothetical protein FCL40_03805 [Ferrimonas sediminicola]
MKHLPAAIAAPLLALALQAPAFAKHHNQDGLPPGLQKKAARGQSLPPGWQKKLSVGQMIDDDLYRHGRVIARDDKGLVTVSIEGKLVRIIEDTREIVKVLGNL